MSATPVIDTPRYIPGTPERPAFYERLRRMVRAAVVFFFRLDVQGLSNIPADGPVIIAENHLSFWDIPSVALLPKRLIHFMAKIEYANNPFAKWLFTNLEAFFVHRGEGDIEAIRNAQAVLKAGQVLLIYPEGHRSDDHALIQAHEGLALIAYRTGAPVVPTATWGSEQVARGGHFAFWRPTVHIRYGAPLTFVAQGKKATRAELQAATAKIMGTIAAMLPESYRGEYATTAHEVEQPPFSQIEAPIASPGVHA